MRVKHGEKKQKEDEVVRAKGVFLSAVCHAGREVGRGKTLKSRREPWLTSS